MKQKHEINNNTVSYKDLHRKMKSEDSVTYSELFELNVNNINRELIENKIVLDIGGNKGYFSIQCIELGAKETYCFEPVKSIYSKLLEFTKDIPQIKTYNLAVFDGTLSEITIDDDGPASNIWNNKNSKDVIKCISLEDALSYIKEEGEKVLKLDCEGAEYEILLNTPIEVLRNFEYIFVEIHYEVNPKHLKDYNSIHNKLLANGFENVISYHCAGTFYSDGSFVPGCQVHNFKRIEESIKTKVYDCFLFNDELDLLEIRLEQLNNVVDYFVLVEANQTHQCKIKTLQYENNKERFKKFHDKIIHIKVENSFTDNSWSNEAIQRYEIIEGLRNCNLNDIILISDADEIPTVSAIENYKRNGIKSLSQKLYYYNLHNYVSDWTAAKIMQYKDILNLLNTTNDENIKTTIFSNLRWGTYDIIENAGWHLSYFYDAKNIIKKLQSFSHTEFLKYPFNNETYINECIDKNENFLNSNKLCYQDLNDTNPPYILNNLKKYKNIGFIKTDYKKDLLIICCSNDDFIEYTKASISSVILNGNWVDDIMVISSGHNEKFKQDLLLKNIYYLSIDDFGETFFDFIQNNETGKYEGDWPIEIYLRYVPLFIESFKYWNNIVYLDTDVIIEKDINFLKNNESVLGIKTDMNKYDLLKNINTSNIDSLITENCFDKIKTVSHCTVFSINTKLFTTENRNLFKEISKKYTSQSVLTDTLVYNCVFNYNNFFEDNIFIDYLHYKNNNLNQDLSLYTLIHCNHFLPPWDIKNQYYNKWKESLIAFNDISNVTIINSDILNHIYEDILSIKKNTFLNNLIKYAKPQCPFIFEEIFEQNVYCVNNIEFNNKTLIDIGGYRGFFALKALQNNIKECHVFEPHPIHYKLTKDNFKYFNNVTVYNMAVSDRNTQFVTITDGDGAANIYDKQSVYADNIPCTYLTNILNKCQVNPNGYLLKMDCEGSEYDIINDTSYEILNMFEYIYLEAHANQHPNHNYGWTYIINKLNENNFSLVGEGPVMGTYYQDGWVPGDAVRTYKFKRNNYTNKI